MRILMLTHRIPYPPNKGDKIRAFHILNHLARSHEVYLATLIDDAADIAGVAALQGVAREVLSARIDQPARKLLGLMQILRGGSITVGHFYSRSLQDGIDRLLDRIEVDAVFCSCSPTAEYLFRSRHAGGKLQGVLKVMDLIDVDSHKWSQYSTQSGFAMSRIYRHEAATLGDYERLIASRFDHLLVVSEQEMKFFPGNEVPPNLRAIPNGVDLEYFSPANAGRANPGPSLVFTGVMDYWPNVEGVTWFARQVLPEIRRTVPDVQFTIVGSRPTAEVRRLAEIPGVTVTGFVDDVRTFIGPAGLCVVPLRIARGIQNKVLEAMAMGKAVITTPQAFEGVRAVAGEDLVVAQDAGEFVEAAVALLRDNERALGIGASARRCVERNYAWSENLSRLRDVGL